MSNSAKVERLRAQAARLHTAGQLDEAERLYAAILALHRRDLQARHMLGVLRLQQGRAAEALALVAAVKAEAPGDAAIRTHHALILHVLGRADDALAGFNAALALAPDNPLTLMYRGNFLVETGQLVQALADYDRVLRSQPRHDEAWFRRGGALWLMERFDEALASYGNALAVNPGHAAALFNSGTVLLKLERYSEALAVFERVRALVPGHRYALGAAAGALLGCCDLARWEEYRGLLMDAVRAHTAVVVPLVFMPFCDDEALRRDCAALFVADRVPPPGPPLWKGEAYGHARIRIAYLSADFRRHATAELLTSLIERHDRARFEVTAISFGPDDASPMRRRLMAGFDRFIDVQGKSDGAVAQLLRDGEFDIAVDLKAHTEGARPGILAHRPCPVQVNWLGYPGTFAAPWLDYVIADATVLPFDRQPFHGEHIVHLPHCYQVNDGGRVIADRTPTRAEAGLPESGFVFCCFNAAWKMTPRMFDIWMRLLQAVPGSVLWLLEDNAAAPAHLRAAAMARGVDPARLVFAPKLASPDHLARHRLADLFVDTLPYNAHTTASDALWTGLPLVTCLGRSFDGRVAASLLKAVGLPELIAASLEDYEALALALARDPARLAELRAKLAANRTTSTLFDTDRFRQAIEAAYIRMVEIARSGGAPQSFAVPDAAPQRAAR